ncbi:nose resistant to fluoxetine protein 6-like [Ochlerotatus camptorhynchus]|uniref:nose resistant to fluoxetine protein 6-like n=1 Tax=Ochlerotatus camptorhynchus TaxID=644619 RepID=UPI0031D571BB
MAVAKKVNSSVWLVQQTMKRTGLDVFKVRKAPNRTDKQNTVAKSHARKLYYELLVQPKFNYEGQAPENREGLQSRQGFEERVDERMLTGYILHFKKTPPKVPLFINLSLWAISLSILFGLVFGVWDGELSVPATALYVSLGHTAWGVALIWITLSCCWGYATPVNKILSYQAFFPLSRLSYCAYLLHPVVMMVTSFQMESPMHLQHVIVVTMFFGNAVISFILAYFVSLVFEAPVVKLLKLVFRK